MNDYDGPMPKLQRLPAQLLEMMMLNGEHYSRASAMYNNMFCIASTQVVNDKEIPGYARIHGK